MYILCNYFWTTESITDKEKNKTYKNILLLKVLKIYVRFKSEF